MLVWGLKAATHYALTRNSGIIILYVILIVFKLEKSNESEPQFEQENQRIDQVVQAVHREKLEHRPCSL